MVTDPLLALVTATRLATVKGDWWAMGLGIEMAAQLGVWLVVTMAQKLEREKVREKALQTGVEKATRLVHQLGKLLASVKAQVKVKRLESELEENWGYLLVVSLEFQLEMELGHEKVQVMGVHWVCWLGLQREVQKGKELDQLLALLKEVDWAHLKEKVWDQLWEAQSGSQLAHESVLQMECRWEHWKV
jgi:hypothetical protein